MTLEEAIEILTDRFPSPELVEDDNLYDAVKLGIEALEFLSQWERDHNGEKLVILPGETED